MNFKDKMQKKGGIQIGNQFRDIYTDSEYSDTIPENISDIESQIEKLIDKTWESAWLIGKRLAHIRLNFLDDLGFDNIYDYAVNKFNFSRRTCYNFIYLAENFTRVQSIALGSKLYLLQSLDEDSKQKYLEWIESENPTRRQIEEKIKSESSKPGRPKKDINISKAKLIIDFKQIGKKIKPGKQDEFLEVLRNLISKYFE